MSRIFLTIVFAMGTAHANLLDNTSKIGSAFPPAFNSHFVCGIDAQPANSFQCTCSPDGNNWTVWTMVPFTTNDTLYPNSGTYVVPNRACTQGGGEFGFSIGKNTFVNPNVDEIVSYYIDPGACDLGNHGTYAPPAVGTSAPTRLGPRLGIATTPDPNPQNCTTGQTFVFATVPNGSIHGIGDTWVAAFPQQGNLAPTWTDITTSVAGGGGGNWPVDSNFPPLAAALSDAFAPAPLNMPMVAVRADTLTQVQLFIFDGNAWEPFRSPPLPNGAQIANSIAIAPTTPFDPDQCDEFYEWIIVTGSDGHAYKAQLGWAQCIGDWEWSSWQDLGTSHADTSTDTVAASWFTSGAGVPDEEVYMNVLAPFTGEWARDPVNGWTRLTTLASWPNGYTSVGYSSVVRFPKQLGQFQDNVYSLCQAAGPVAPRV